MNRRRFLATTLVVFILMMSTGLTFAREPGLEPGYQPQTAMGSTFTYQGRLEDGDGPLNGVCNLTFELYDAPGSGSPPSGGTQLGIQNLTNKTIIDGYFTVHLDFGSSVFSGQARWLQVSVDCGAGLVTLAPRLELTPSPYALYADRAGVDFAGSGTAETVSRSDHDHWGQIWSGSGTGLALDGGNTGLSATGEDFGVYGRNDTVGGTGMLGHATAASGKSIGVGGLSDSPEGRGVDGWASATSGDTYGVYGHSESDTGTGVYGYANAASGENFGVKGESKSSDGRGVYGLATANIGINYGVLGRSDSDSGRGVAGWAGATSGDTYGVFGRSDSTSGLGVAGWAIATSGSTYGVFGQSESNSGTGVYGYAKFSSGRNYGVMGESESSDGRGVAGVALATNGATFGTYGRSESDSGSGVAGHANATSGETNGVYGRSDSPDGRGVYGLGNYGVYGESENINGRGVYGYASDNRAESIGVYGSTGSDWGYGGYFVGDVHVTGDLDATGAKPFKIDHPLDPQNSYLYHFSQEAPQVQNVYNDVVTLDADGEAIVTLPDYFSALNTGPYRYQLTAIGGAMPNLHIAHEIQENTFAIAGGEPGLKVSWEVTAVRNDPYLHDHPVQSEQEKPEDEKGTYLYPQGYGQPQEMGLDYQRDQDLLAK